MSLPTLLPLILVEILHTEARPPSDDMCPRCHQQRGEGAPFAGGNLCEFGEPPATIVYVMVPHFVAVENDIAKKLDSPLPAT